MCIRFGNLSNKVKGLGFIVSIFGTQSSGVQRPSGQEVWDAKPQGAQRQSSSYRLVHLQVVELFRFWPVVVRRQDFVSIRYFHQLWSESWPVLEAELPMNWASPSELVLLMVSSLLRHGLPGHWQGSVPPSPTNHQEFCPHQDFYPYSLNSRLILLPPELTIEGTTTGGHRGLCGISV